MEFSSNEQGNRQWVGNDPLQSLRELRTQVVSSGKMLTDLSMINPDLAPPRLLMDRLMEASMKSDNHRYAVSRGIRKLREAFARKYDQAFQVQIDPETEVCVTMGTKDALLDALHALFGAGSRVLLPSPTYAAHLSAARLAQLNPIFFSLSADEGQILKNIDEAVAGAADTNSPVKVILLNFPNNPTGIAVSPQFWKSVVQIAKERNILVINDFVYGEMGFNPVPSLLSAPDAKLCSLETYSLSKAYNVPGWRVGAILGNSEAIGLISRLKSHIDYGIFLPLQMAASAALTSKSDLVGPTVAQYKRRCRLLVDLLKAKGFKVEMPHAGASVWAELPKDASVDSADEYAARLLERTGFLVLPGSLFGPEYARFIRIAAVASEEKLRELVEVA